MNELEGMIDSVSSHYDLLILIAIIICLGILAFFCASETALMSASKIKIRHLVEKDIKKARTVLSVTEKPEKLFNTILTAQNLFTTLASALGTILAIKYFGAYGVILAPVIITIFIVIFGEVTPKIYAASKAEKVALKVAGPIDKIVRFMSPVVFVLIAATKFFVKILGGSTKQEPYHLTEEEIKTVIDISTREGVITSDEKSMLKRVFRFADITVSEVMAPRVEMVCLEAESNLNKISEVIKQTGHSRIPIYEGNIDNITGIVYAKDLLGFFDKLPEDLLARDIAREPIFVPASQKIIKLLSALKKKKNTMAIIIDEFGGTAGLVTVELLLEEIVGDIQDEYDFEQTVFQKVASQTFRVSAKIDIFELNEKLPLKIPEGEYNTLAGFIIDFLGRIPREAELFEYKRIKFKIIKVKKNKLDLVEIQLPQK